LREVGRLPETGTVDGTEGERESKRHLERPAPSDECSVLATLAATILQIFQIGAVNRIFESWGLRRDHTRLDLLPGLLGVLAGSPILPSRLK
jgi:hypothetical protein